MPNPFAHIELSTDDVKKAKKFYQAVFAWKLNDMPAMAYTMIDVGGGVGGGIQKKQMPEAPTAWLPYVKVDDVKATIAKAVKAGATAVLPFQEIGEMGAIGIFTDPAGAALGLWEESKTAPAAPPPPAPPAAKKAPAPAKKKAPVKKAAAPAPAKKAPAKKAAAPAPAKKAPAKKPPAKKVAAAPAPAPAPAKKAPAKKK
jgi:uncharacterized protein